MKGLASKVCFRLFAFRIPGLLFLSSGLQASLRRFFQSFHPDAQTPARLSPGTGGNVGRLFFRQMKELISRVAAEQAVEQKAPNEAFVIQEATLRCKKRS